MLILLVARMLPKCGLPGFIGLKGLRIDPVEVILATVHGQKGFIEALPLAMGIGFFCSASVISLPKAPSA